MTNITITNFRKNIYKVVENTIRYNDVVNISTKDGNAVMISEEDYNSMIETLRFASIPGMREKLIEGLNTPLKETVTEEETGW